MSVCHQVSLEEDKGNTLGCDKCTFTAKNKGWITRHMKTCHEIIMAMGSTDQGPPPPPSSCSWFWLGQEGQDQGPFPCFLMLRWLNNGLLPADLMIKREGDEEYASLEDFQKMYGSQLFG